MLVSNIVEWGQLLNDWLRVEGSASLDQQLICDEVSSSYGGWNHNIVLRGSQVASHHIFLFVYFIDVSRENADRVIWKPFKYVLGNVVCSRVWYHLVKIWNCDLRQKPLWGLSYVIIVKSIEQIYFSSVMVALHLHGLVYSEVSDILLSQKMWVNRLLKWISIILVAIQQLLLLTRFLTFNLQIGFNGIVKLGRFDRRKTIFQRSRKWGITLNIGVGQNLICNAFLVTFRARFILTFFLRLDFGFFDLMFQLLINIFILSFVQLGF